MSGPISVNVETRRPGKTKRQLPSSYRLIPGLKTAPWRNPEAHEGMRLTHYDSDWLAH
jgi:hypothetical protein